MLKTDRSAATVRAAAAPATPWAQPPTPGPLHHSARLTAQRARFAAAFGPVVQCLKVGGDDAGVVFLATKHFSGSNALWAAARLVLNRMKDADTDYADVDEIVNTVKADPDVAREMLAAEQLKIAREAELKRKAESPTIYKGFDRDGNITEYDIEKGVWRSLNRKGKLDYELVVTLDSGVVYSFHLHPPDVRGDPIPGEVMRGGRPTMTQTSGAVIDCIMKHHPKPAEW